MLRRLANPEIFIGLVAPVGVDLNPIKASLAGSFQLKGYTPVHIKVTDVFPVLEKTFSGKGSLNSTNYYDRVTKYIAYGDTLREKFDRHEILAASAVFEVARSRRRAFKSGDMPPMEKYERRVFIIDQLKRPEEVALLRHVYENLFFQVSVYARRETRAKYIASKVVKELAALPSKTPESMAWELVAADENEAAKNYGQRVGKTFHGADFIINTEIAAEPLEEQVRRFTDLMFGSNNISPTKSEYGMYAAKGAALRTLDLSRQVGAAIFSKEGEVISLGSNEVPKAGGGTYWGDEIGVDAREYTREGDTNDDLKLTVARQFFRLMASTYNIDASFESFMALEEVKEARFMDALEYGRIVHAEMSALMDAARRGCAVKSSVMYTTTFPCHMCAKHIVAAGVAKVVYLEPYPKSLVPDLHLDAISVDGSDRGIYRKYPALEFEHFYGVTPRRYRELFERGKRKDDHGRFRPFVQSPPQPMMATFMPAYAQLEKTVIQVGMQELGNLVRQEREIISVAP